MRITISDFFPLLSIFTIRRGFLARYGLNGTRFENGKRYSEM